MFLCISAIVDFCHLCLICVPHQVVHFRSVIFIVSLCETVLVLLVLVVTVLLCLYGVTVTVVATDLRYRCTVVYMFLIMVSSSIQDKQIGSKGVQGVTTLITNCKLYL